MVPFYESLTRIINSFSDPSEATEVLRNLSMNLYPQVVSFQEITRLMQQCELLDGLQVEATSTLPTNALSKGSRIAASSITLFSGILPGRSFIIIFKHLCNFRSANNLLTNIKYVLQAQNGAVRVI